MKDLIKVFSKYLCCGAATAGVTAPVTYLTTRENIEENEEFKDISNQVRKQRESIENLGKEKKIADEKITKLKKCISDVEVISHSKNVRGVLQTENITVFGGTNRECKH